MLNECNGECNNAGPLRQLVPNRSERPSPVPPPSGLMSRPTLAGEQQAMLYGLAVGKM